MLEPATTMSKTCTIHMRGEVFLLTIDQIVFDSPNYFTSCFLGDFAESETRNLQLSRDPDLFKIVLDYLSGYQVLPLDDSVIPRRMNRESALRNLRADAEFYSLDGLVAQIPNTQETPSLRNSLPSDYVVLSGSDVSFEHLAKLVLPICIGCMGCSRAHRYRISRRASGKACLQWDVPPYVGPLSSPSATSPAHSWNHKAVPTPCKLAGA